MNNLLIATYLIVTVCSICGGYTRIIYPNVSSDVAEKVKPLNTQYTLILSLIIGLALSTYFYAGISGSNVELGFLLQLGLLSGVAVFKNIDRLHKIKLNRDMG
ncbi:hypothetical protein ORJ66_04860 [Pseudoalteromonas tunicata]|uniref:hypothetical protein n=1 Tax=Pseudoalteromonas tunicata TaxID=314281 RepID=UPI00273F5A8B|nr:hypothetical protein [Pseudoalteromonas tunicata]MDP5212372.1 hypothetical protein [Pseudoalteromonas tunicata]